MCILLNISWGNVRPGYTVHCRMKFNLILSLDISLPKSLSYLILPRSFPPPYFYSCYFLSSSALLHPPRFYFTSTLFLIERSLNFLWPSSIYILIWQARLSFWLGSSSLEGRGHSIQWSILLVFFFCFQAPIWLDSAIYWSCFYLKFWYFIMFFALFFS